MKGKPRRAAALPSGAARELNALLDTGATLYAAGRFAEAERAFARAEAAAPSDRRAPYSLAILDLRAGRLDAARRRFKAVAAAEPGHFAAHHNLAAASAGAGLWSEAARAYARAFQLKPDAVETGFSLARALAVLGRIDEAAATYRRLAADPGVRARALTRLAILAPAAVSDEERAFLAAGAADEAQDEETRARLAFALGEALDARGEADAAFAAFAAGNAAKSRALGPAVGAAAAAHARSQRAIMTHYGVGRFAALKPRKAGSEAPIFIVGFPRSGSTLIEQILASHRDVAAMGETGALTALINAGVEDPAAVARAYLAVMREKGWKATPRFTDKTLENFLNLGAIALAFPGAVIIEAVREPVDAAFACWRQLFATGNETLYDFEHIAEELVRCERMMAHWRATLPGRVSQVRLEALVAAPEAQIRRLVTEVCALRWDPACLAFHRARRPVTSASAAQVRRPIFTTSLGRWRRHEARLAGLVAAIERARSAA